MSSPSSSPSTPMLLTPESTGSMTGVAIDPAQASPTKKVRPAVYPNTNAANKPQKPFSRSAAKRESVMTLGSIEHLQHYFTKTGIAAKKNPLMNKPRNGFVPAIGPAHPLPINAHTRAVSSKDIDLPPSPIIPHAAVRVFPPHVKAPETDPATLLPGVITDLRAVAHIWGIDSNGEGSNSTRTGSVDEYARVDVLEVLKTTTRAVRSVRNYVLSLPDDSPLVPRLPGKREKGKGGEKGREEDKDALIRRAALEVLTTLRALEEKARVPLSDDAYDAQSDPSSLSPPPTASLPLPIPILNGPTRPTLSITPAPGSPSSVSPTQSQMHVQPQSQDPDASFTYLHIPGRPGLPVPVWEHYDDDGHSPTDDHSDSTEMQKIRWDELLVLAGGGGGWLYRADITLREMVEESGRVGAWLDVVDGLLFGDSAPHLSQEVAAEGGEVEGGKKKERGWDREREKLRQADAKRRASAPMAMSEFRFPPPRPPRARRVVSASPMMGMGMVGALFEEPEEVPGGLGLKHSEDEEEDTPEESDADLPPWARRAPMPLLRRTHLLLATHLPPALLAALPELPEGKEVEEKEEFLGALASGQLLCAAYNVVVRRSRKPWGFISADAVHDVHALEAELQLSGSISKRDSGASQGEKDKFGSEGKKGGWTFRRIDNLRLWAAALKLRYLLPIVAPPVPVPSSASTPLSHTSPLPTVRFSSPAPSMPSSPGRPPPSSPSPYLSRNPTEAEEGTGTEIRGREARAREGIVFDASRVARREAGWEDMFEAALKAWTDAVVGERRGER